MKYIMAPLIVGVIIVIVNVDYEKYRDSEPSKPIETIANDSKNHPKNPNTLPTSTRPKPTPNKHYSRSINGLSAEITNAKKNGTSIELVIEFERKDGGNIQVCLNDHSWRTYFIDNDGSEHIADNIKIGNKSSINCIDLRFNEINQKAKAFVTFNPKSDVAFPIKKVIVSTSIGILDFRDTSIF